MEEDALRLHLPSFFTDFFQLLFSSPPSFPFCSSSGARRGRRRRSTVALRWRTRGGARRTARRRGRGALAPTPTTFSWNSFLAVLSVVCRARFSIHRRRRPSRCFCVRECGSVGGSVFKYSVFKYSDSVFRIFPKLRISNTEYEVSCANKKNDKKEYFCQKNDGQMKFWYSTILLV